MIESYSKEARESLQYIVDETTKFLRSPNRIVIDGLYICCRIKTSAGIITTV